VKQNIRHCKPAGQHIAGAAPVTYFADDEMKLSQIAVKS